MAQIESTMFEPGTSAKTKNLPSLTKQERPKRECRTRKRPYDIEQYSSKRLKYDQLDPDDQIDNTCTFGLTNSDTDEENDTESKCSTSDETEQSPSVKQQLDDNSDLEEIEDETTNVHFTKVSSDQNRHIPVVSNQLIIQQQQTLSRHSKRLISQFKYLYNHGLRKSIQPTHPPENTSLINEQILRWELRNTFNRIDLFKEGYCILSNEPFPFYSLCYMCGSMGSDLIYCTNCCEPYHPNCLNEYERPRLNCSLEDYWLCPNCNVCSICGILTSENLLSRMNNDLNFSSQMISCYDCQRNFHFKCLKRSQDHEFPTSNTNNSIILLSRLSHSYLYNQTWSCPSCMKCDCGEDLKSNERNILSLTKTFASQQTLMCGDCCERLELLHREKNDQIETCHFCEKYLEQIQFKSSHRNTLLQCNKCKHRFHAKCDGYFTEDVQILTRIDHLTLNIICSKCDNDEREKIRKDLRDYKIQIMKNIQSNIFSTFQMIISDEDQLKQMDKYLTNLQVFHESHSQTLNLQFFLNDFLTIIRHRLTANDLQRWQSVLHGSILRQCPWFKSSSLLTNSIISTQPAPSMDHNYAMTDQQSTDSLLNYLDNPLNSFFNVHQNDTRKCQLCQSISDHSSQPIGRLISFGINQWVHVGCILAAYAKNLDQPPYILRNIRETIIRCQTKYVCVLCSKLGASVHCYENECYQRFHCHCIQKYYSTIDKTHQTQLNIKNGFLPNLTTLCLKHNGTKTMNNPIHRESTEGINEDESKENLVDSGSVAPKIKCVNTSSTVYGDLSNNLVEFAIDDIRLCIGSLQIDSLGDFDYQIDRIDDNLLPDMNYPNNYRASRLFWSMKNPREKTVYHLHIEIDQTYHTNPSNHRVLVHPMNPMEIHHEQLYERCRKDFEKLQKKIDEHLTNIEEFCQKTMLNKKGLPNPTQSRRKNANPGTATTKRLTKGLPSCVKRQTPKAALKNVSRPRNRFAHEKNASIPSTTKSNPPKENIPISDIQNLFANDLLKSTNVSHFALALVQALRQVGQSTKIQQDSNLNFHPINSSSNGNTTDKSSDTLLKQLLKNITTPQQLHDSQISTINNSVQWRSTISTQSDVPTLLKAYDDVKINGHPQYSFASPTTDNSSNLFPKPTFIPQVDGSIDENDDREICFTVINTLLEQINNELNSSSDRFRTDSEYSMDLSDYVNSPSLIPFTPISPTHRPSLEKKPDISSFELIQLYRQWLKSNFCQVKFTITNDEGYRIISDDLDSAWSTIITSIRNLREEMKFKSLPITNEQSNGHKIFGLTKPILKTMFKQMSSNEPQIGNILLPLSSSTNFNNYSSNFDENFSRKTSNNACTRSNNYERKARERQRFGWLLNQSRKIEYALKSFEIDAALFHARRILLEEASVSLRLYHLHYFSERALLVGSSPIHGCGLFTLIDLIEGQMIIEYTGEVVRPCLTDKRERENEGKGFGCYMFTVDSMNVIDATHRGNKARFINHNCQPNCFAKTVLSGGVKHIVIYALVDITRGSELTYDYSFPEEDVKIPCHCGTTKCRVYLN